MNRIKTLVIAGLCLLGTACNNSNQESAEAQKVLDIIDRVNTHWQSTRTHQKNPFWHNAAYHTGNMEAYFLTGNELYRKYSEDWAEYNSWKGAKSDDKSAWKYLYGENDDYVLFGDWQICFQTYIDLYNIAPDEKKIARAKEVMSYQVNTPHDYYWWWADGLYMVMPVMTKMYKLTGERIYLDKLYEYILYADKIMLDEETGMYFRDGKYVWPEHKSVNGKKDFWARGDGWVLAGLAKVLKDLPEDYEHREFFVNKFRKLASSVAACQRPDGYWTRSLLDPEHAPGPETSGTAFFTYGLLWGINNGYLEKDVYSPVVEKAWDYLAGTALQEGGSVGYVQPIGERAIPGQVVDVNSTADFGVGAFLLAACERYRYITGKDKIAAHTDYLDRREPADITASNPADWKGVHSPIVSFGSTDIRYANNVPFSGDIADTVTLTGWKGERLSALIVVSAPEGLDNLKCSVGDFKSDVSGLKGIGQARFVKYVLSDRYEDKENRASRPANLQPDMLDDVKSLDMKAISTRPIWITVDIPEAAAASIYEGKVSVDAEGLHRDLCIRLKVIDRVLPKASEWDYHLDLWQHPTSVARIEGVKSWSEEHFRKMRPIMQRLADAGQKVITATLNKDPWNHQCYDAYDDMIIWTRNENGTWSYDYTNFDKWVSFMLGLGIDKYINCYSLAPWNDMLHYYDAASKEFVDVQARPGTPEFKEMWTPFLKDFVAHLKANGWLGFTNIAMDERPPVVMDETVALLQEISPELGISLADNHQSFRKYSNITDMCTDLSGYISKSDVEARRANCMTTTFYVCCWPDFPNTMTSCEPAEATYISWYAAAKNYDGFLRWAYNSWPEDPIRDSRFGNWPSGDTYLVYPDDLSSIRLERLREGVQDWEKIHLLRKEFTATGDSENLAKLDAILVPFNSKDRFDGWPDALNKAKAQLNQL